jgi:methylmalonyl-CoA mutase cobalamin-binding subunit
MYTIKQAAQRSGLTVPTVRVWERRYGVVHPSRTPTGYRLYDDEAIDRLIAMRHLVDGRGLRPSQAADVVLAPGADIGMLVAEAASGAGSPAARATAEGLGMDDFLEAADGLDVGTMERVLDEWFAAERFEAAIEHLVFPALRRLGEGWADGRVDPAVEHAASETIRRRLAHFFDAAAVSGSGRRILVGLPPGGQHEIGALAFGTAARRRGLDVVYLGANVPLESWLTAARTSGAGLAVVGVVSPSDVAAAAGVVAALRRMAQPPVVALGGARAGAVTDDGEVIVLPAGLEASVGAVRELIAPAA